MVVPSRVGAAQEKVGGHAVVVAGLYHKGEARLTDTVFIVAEQRLGDSQVLGRRALGDALFPAAAGRGNGKIGTHSCTHLIYDLFVTPRRLRDGS